LHDFLDQILLVVSDIKVSEEDAAGAEGSEAGQVHTEHGQTEPDQPETQEYQVAGEDDYQGHPMKFIRFFETLLAYNQCPAYRGYLCSR
jgi:hypothetical protein